MTVHVWDRYLIVHDQSDRRWLVIRPPTLGKRQGEVIAHCPTEAWAIETCEALNNPTPQGGAKP